MGKTDLILAVDVGATSLKMGEFSYSGSEQMTLEQYAYTKYSQEKVDENNRITLLEEAFTATINKYNFTAKKVYLSISGQSAFIRFVKLPPTSDKKQKIQQLVAYEARQNVPYPMKEVTWDYQLSNVKMEGLDEINAMLAVAKNSLITEIVNIIEKNKFLVKVVDISPVACFNVAWREKIGEKESAMVLNIGGACSTLVIIDNSSFYTRTIPIGGQTITQQISKKFEISFKEAEEMKQKFGSVTLSDINEKDKTKEEIEIAKIITDNFTRLYGDITRSINVYKSQQHGNTPQKLYLTGGSSVIDSTAQFFNSKLKIPVEHFDPFRFVEFGGSLGQEELTNLKNTAAEIIGLGLRKQIACPIEISLLPPEMVRQQNIRAKQPYFIATLFAIILCLFLILFGMYIRKNSVVDLIHSSEKQTSVTEKRLNIMKSYLTKLEEAKGKFNATTNYLKGRNTWINTLNTIQRCLPDNTWIVKLSLTKKTSTVVTTQKRISIFGKTKIIRGAKKQDASKLDEWILIKAHSLALSKNNQISSAEKFKNNLLKSKTFSDDGKDIIITDFNTDPDESNNIDTFNIKIKL